jgi:hypothetical protein
MLSEDQAFRGRHHWIFFIYIPDSHTVGARRKKSKLTRGTK